MANVLITGANRGIGLEIARQYLEAGDRVYAGCRVPAKADALQALAADSGGRLTVLALDVADPPSIAAAAREVGSGPIDILINNAGVLGGPYQEQTLAGMNYDNWRDAFEVMTVGPFRVLQTFADRFVEGTKLANVTSQLAASTWPTPGLYAYASVKAASNRLVQGLAHEFRPRGVMIIALHPGYVSTDMTGHRGDITPTESARGIRTVMAGLHPEDSGKFFKWNGEIHPW